MTNIGKPYEGKPHVRFDEEGQRCLPFTLESGAGGLLFLSKKR
ncbi:hypothetical protein E6C60_4067 [Paenibacillus algicola]|uniref:Uncharacterized protein n=1 Tax=Paenibacillus algicola TaxID=2565926 RepID=A0A4P8XPJ9_9BACL|nr:hypothetical protein E6C60_4067 [Paenibacillus algicola]